MTSDQLGELRADRATLFAALFGAGLDGCRFPGARQGRARHPSSACYESGRADRRQYPEPDRCAPNACDRKLLAPFASRIDGLSGLAAMTQRRSTRSPAGMSWSRPHGWRGPGKGQTRPARRAPAAPRSGLLSLPRQHAGDRRAQSRLSRHLRLRQRFPGASRRASGGTPRPIRCSRHRRRRGRRACSAFRQDHGATLADLGEAGLARGDRCLVRRDRDARRRFAHVQIFENSGAMMGAPTRIRTARSGRRIISPTRSRSRTAPAPLARRARHGRCSLKSAAREAGGEREVSANARWLAIVPYWAAWPFETLLLPRFPVAAAARSRRTRSRTRSPSCWAI